MKPNENNSGAERSACQKRTSLLVSMDAKCEKAGGKRGKATNMMEKPLTMGSTDTRPYFHTCIPIQALCNQQQTATNNEQPTNEANESVGPSTKERVKCFIFKSSPKSIQPAIAIPPTTCIEHGLVMNNYDFQFKEHFPTSLAI